jgi:hypothetical protein
MSVNTRTKRWDSVSSLQSISDMWNGEEGGTWLSTAQQSQMGRPMGRCYMSILLYFEGCHLPDQKEAQMRSRSEVGYPNGE